MKVMEFEINCQKSMNLTALNQVRWRVGVGEIAVRVG